MRLWLWGGTVLDVLLMVPGIYMALAALETAQPGAFFEPATFIAGLFTALPLFCIACPAAVWRTQLRGRVTRHAGLLLAAPLLYAVFLLIFLYFG